jgi:hypothetical protein
MRVVERFRRPGDDELTIDITIHDPIAFTEPWSATRLFRSANDWQIEESICLDNESFTDFEQALIEFEGGAAGN